LLIQNQSQSSTSHESDLMSINVPRTFQLLLVCLIATPAFLPNTQAQDRFDWMPADASSGQF